YDPGEIMVFKFKGITQQMVDEWACFAIHDKGLSGPISGWGELSQVGDNVYDRIQAPDEPGEYAMVLLSKWWQNGSFSELLVSSVPFTVGMAAKDGHISLNKTAFTAMEAITVSYSDITQNMVNSRAIVAIFPKGAAHGQNMLPGSQYVKLGSGAVTIHAPNQNSEFEMRLYSVDSNYNADSFVMAIPFTVSGATGSAWAQNELEKASALGLIPDKLKGQDLSKPITRAEFAAVAVLVYENLSGTKTTPSRDTMFTDTKDADVLKAHNTGLMVGVSADKFEPNTLLNREQAATALTRVLKCAYIPGWTFATDGNYTLNSTRPAPFADDAKISTWAKESVYFMAANNIVGGVGNNNFAPRAITTAEQAAGYASATREQAIIIGLRIVDNLKDKPIDFTKN
ncbi:MAG: S-layer homology domain-containing protein, partial [Dehalococcoidia bacterium]|nr:S-layer homology domain-containing protein [Dehalococcoidia bacterium]